MAVCRSSSQARCLLKAGAVAHPSLERRSSLCARCFSETGQHHRAAPGDARQLGAVCKATELLHAVPWATSSMLIGRSWLWYLWRNRRSIGCFIACGKSNITTAIEIFKLSNRIIQQETFKKSLLQRSRATVLASRGCGRWNIGGRARAPASAGNPWSPTGSPNKSFDGA